MRPAGDPAPAMRTVTRPAPALSPSPAPLFPPIPPLLRSTDTSCTAGTHHCIPRRQHTTRHVRTSAPGASAAAARRASGRRQRGRPARQANVRALDRMAGTGGAHGPVAGGASSCPALRARLAAGKAPPVRHCSDARSVISHRMQRWQMRSISVSAMDAQRATLTWLGPRPPAPGPTPVAGRALSRAADAPRPCLPRGPSRCGRHGARPVQLRRRQRAVAPPRRRAGVPDRTACLAPATHTRSTHTGRLTRLIGADALMHTLNTHAAVRCGLAVRRASVPLCLRPACRAAAQGVGGRGGRAGACSRAPQTFQKSRNVLRLGPNLAPARPPASVPHPRPGPSYIPRSTVHWFWNQQQLAALAAQRTAACQSSFLGWKRRREARGEGMSHVLVHKLTPVLVLVLVLEHEHARQAREREAPRAAAGR